MTWKSNSEPPHGSLEDAFTLIEIVVSLTIVAVIAAVAIPTMKGLQREEKTRESITALASIVQEARHRAMSERRSYQIVFEPGGIHASPVMYPYEKLEDFLAELEKLRKPPERDAMQREEIEHQEIAGRDEASEPSMEKSRRHEPPWTLTIPMIDGTECGVLMWGDGEWDNLDGGKMRRWVFQPAGMSNPAQIRLRSESGELEAGFDVLTGEMSHERILSKHP